MSFDPAQNRGASQRTTGPPGGPQPPGGPPVSWSQNDAAPPPLAWTADIPPPEWSGFVGSPPDWGESVDPVPPPLHPAESVPSFGVRYTRFVNEDIVEGAATGGNHVYAHESRPRAPGEFEQHVVQHSPGVWGADASGDELKRVFQYHRRCNPYRPLPLSDPGRAAAPASRVADAGVLHDSRRGDGVITIGRGDHEVAHLLSGGGRWDVHVLNEALAILRRRAETSDYADPYVNQLLIPDRVETEPHRPDRASAVVERRISTSYKTMAGRGRMPLGDYLRRPRVSERERMSIAANLVGVVCMLHSARVTHGCISRDSVFVDLVDSRDVAGEFEARGTILLTSMGCGAAMAMSRLVDNPKSDSDFDAKAAVDRRQLLEVLLDLFHTQPRRGSTHRQEQAVAVSLRLPVNIHPALAHICFDMAFSEFTGLHGIATVLDGLVRRGGALTYSPLPDHSSVPAGVGYIGRNPAPTPPEVDVTLMGWSDAYPTLERFDACSEHPSALPVNARVLIPVYTDAGTFWRFGRVAWTSMGADSAPEWVAVDVDTQYASAHGPPHRRVFIDARRQFVYVLCTW